MLDLVNCKKCGPVQAVFQECSNGPHKAKFLCPKCNSFLRWIGSADIARIKGNQPSKEVRRRETEKLVNRYSKGFCELCLRAKNQLPGTQTLEAHHVIEVQDGGSDERNNIWIVCTSCHKFVHHQRTYLGHYHQERQPHTQFMEAA